MYVSQTFINKKNNEKEEIESWLSYAFNSKNVYQYLSGFNKKINKPLLGINETNVRMYVFPF